MTEAYIFSIWFFGVGVFLGNMIGYFRGYRKAMDYASKRLDELQR